MADVPGRRGGSRLRLTAPLRLSIYPRRRSSHFLFSIRYSVGRSQPELGLLNTTHVAVPEPGTAPLRSV